MVLVHCFLLVAPLSMFKILSLSWTAKKVWYEKKLYKFEMQIFSHNSLLLEVELKNFHTAHLTALYLYFKFHFFSHAVAQKCCRQAYYIKKKLMNLLHNISLHWCFFLYQVFISFKTLKTLCCIDRQNNIYLFSGKFLVS